MTAINTEAKLLGADPKLEVAVLKIETRGIDVPFYDLAKNRHCDSRHSGVSIQ